MLKILQARLQQYVNQELLDIQAGFRKEPDEPMDCSLPDSSVHGIFQARVLEWGAIAFSGKELWLRLFFILFF